jgi:hypothetical protein
LIEEEEEETGQITCQLLAGQASLWTWDLRDRLSMASLFHVEIKHSKLVLHEHYLLPFFLSNMHKKIKMGVFGIRSTPKCRDATQPWKVASTKKHVFWLEFCQFFPLIFLSSFHGDMKSIQSIA